MKASEIGEMTGLLLSNGQEATDTQIDYCYFGGVKYRNNAVRSHLDRIAKGDHCLIGVRQDWRNDEGYAYFSIDEYEFQNGVLIKRSPQLIYEEP